MKYSIEIHEKVIIAIEDGVKRIIREYHLDGKEQDSLGDVFRAIFKREKNLYAWLGVSEEAMRALFLSPNETAFNEGAMGFDNFLKRLGYDSSREFYMDLLADPDKMRALVQKRFAVKVEENTKAFKLEL